MIKLLLICMCAAMLSNVCGSLDNIVIPNINWKNVLFSDAFESYNANNTNKNDADKIEGIVRKVERQYGIPQGMLVAIALVESGKQCRESRKMVIWPWTVNANGRSYFLKSKKDAIQKVLNLKARGINVIDVGCMQINLLHHPKAFSSLENAFDPKKNIEYAACFLKRLFEKNKSWEKAVCYYHSQNKKFYKQYYCSVMKQYKVTSKTFRQHDNVIPYLCCAKHRNNVDDVISQKLHKLGRMVLVKNSSKFQGLYN